MSNPPNSERSVVQLGICHRIVQFPTLSALADIGDPDAGPHARWLATSSRRLPDIDPDNTQGISSGRVDHEVLDATSEEDIARQARDDDAEAMRDMGRFARRVRRRLGLTQVEFARRIDVPHETIRNWEQGKRGYPPRDIARKLVNHRLDCLTRSASRRLQRRLPTRQTNLG